MDEADTGQLVVLVSLGVPLQTRAAGQWRDQNRSGWQALLPHFQAAVAVTNEAVTDERSS